MESVKDYRKTNLSENSSVSKVVSERAVESSESFHTACYNTEKPGRIETENLKGNKRACGVQGDLEQNNTAQGQLEIPGDSTCAFIHFFFKKTGHIFRLVLAFIF